MAKVEIIFTQDVINEMDARGAKYPEGFNNGPVFIGVEEGNYGAADGMYGVRTDDGLYLYPLHNIRRVKIS